MCMCLLRHGCVRVSCNVVYIMVASWERETIEWPTGIRHSDTSTLQKMKSYTLVFVVLTTVLLYTEYANAQEICRQENCVTPDKCEVLMNGKSLCYEQGTSCCSVVKEKFRIYCHQHGGQCMDGCVSALRRNAVDCENNQVCCVLV